MNIAVIPARGGSKRIPRKNIRNFHGRPMISYAIKVAQKSQLFDRIIVSTDDEEIAAISENYGAGVPWRRSPELADDFATTLDVMQDAAQKLSSEVPPNTKICCIYPTTPLLRAHYLQVGASVIHDHEWDYVFSAVRNASPIQRSFYVTDSAQVQLNFPEYELIRTQDLPVSFHDAGQFYWGSLESWENKLPVFSQKSTIIEIPNHLSVDMDREEDWMLAEKLYSLLKKGDESR